MLNKYNALKTSFIEGKTLPVNIRKKYLTKLYDVISVKEELIYEALYNDLNKCNYESYLTEVSSVLSELKYIIQNLESWAKPQKVSTPIALLPAKSFYIAEPLGVTLIIAPWNYPFLLVFSPLMGAIAAGNCVMVKPSSQTASTSNVIAEIISEVFPEDICCCILGNASIGNEMLSYKWDHIFFTGSTNVGKTIYESAAANLTPVTLELGGKSPTIVDKDANIKVAAKRIAWGKIINAGQTCIAPDYLFAHESINDELCENIILNIKEMLGSNPLENDNYPKIINDKHFKRLIGYITNSKKIYGGSNHEAYRKIEPTLIDSPAFDSPVMQEEIFGPILPVFKYSDIEEPVKHIKRNNKPLACYIFTNNIKLERYLIDNIPFGGGCINDVLMHFANHHLPFGGVGESGTGRYHGYKSFETFSNIKGIVKKSVLFDFPFRFQPFEKRNLKLLKKMR